MARDDSRTQPRVVKALRYGLQESLHERAEVLARKVQDGVFCAADECPDREGDGP